MVDNSVVADSQEGRVCLQANECVDNTHNCDLNANCFDKDGSFGCKCKKGYDGDGFECDDFDECVNHMHTCDANAVCLNSIASYKCECSEDRFAYDVLQ